MEFQEGGGFFKVMALTLDALGLDVAELVQSFLDWRDSRWPCMPRMASTGIRIWGLGLCENSSDSSRGKRLRRQAASASSWASWVSVGVAGLYSSKKWRQWS